MYNKTPKFSKREAPSASPITCYYPHSRPDSERNWIDKPYYQIVSIDPAIHNYAIRIERWYKEEKQIIPILFDKITLSDKNKEEDDIVDNVYVNLSNFLDQYLDLFMDCNYIICEKQMAINYNSLRIMQHTISYFTTKLKDNELLSSIIELCPKLKGLMLGAPKGMNYNETKKWSVVKCGEILEERGDEVSLLILNQSKTKKDDLADTVCQARALLIYLKLDFGEITKDKEFMDNHKYLYAGTIPTVKITKPRKKVEKEKVPPKPKMIYDEVDGNGIPKKRLIRKV